MSDGNLDDMISEEVDTSKLDPSVRRMMAANREAKKRAPSGSVLVERQKKRGKFFPFRLQKNESRKIVILSKPLTLLGHQFATRWINKNGNSFPEKSWGISAGWAFPDDPDQAGYVQTGKPCPATLAIGDPRPITVMIVAEFNKYTIKNGPNKGKESRVQVRVMEVSNLGAQNQLADQACTKTAGGSLLFCIMKVSRSDSGTSPAIGDSFTVVDKATKEKIQADKDIMEQLKEIDLTAAYAPLSEEEAVEACRAHKRIMDQHNDGEGYIHEGMQRVLSGSYDISGGLDDGDDPFGSDSDGDIGGGLGALDDVEEGDSGFTLEGASEDDEETKENPAETASAPAEEEDDGFDPWA